MLMAVSNSMAYLFSFEKNKFLLSLMKMGGFFKNSQGFFQMLKHTGACVGGDYARSVILGIPTGGCLDIHLVETYSTPFAKVRIWSRYLRQFEGYTHRTLCGGTYRGKTVSLFIVELFILI